MQGKAIELTSKEMIMLETSLSLYQSYLRKQIKRGRVSHSNTYQEVNTLYDKITFFGVSKGQKYWMVVDDEGNRSTQEELIK